MVLVAHSSRLRSILAGQSWQQELKTPVSYQQLRPERRDEHKRVTQLSASIIQEPNSWSGAADFQDGSSLISVLTTVSGGVQGTPDPDSLSLRLPSRVILDCVNLTIKNHLSQRPAEFTDHVFLKVHSSASESLTCKHQKPTLGSTVCKAVSFSRSSSQAFEQHSLNQRLICTQSDTCTQCYNKMCVE